MSQNFNFGFSGDDIDIDSDGADIHFSGGETEDNTSSTAQLIEPRLHTLQELVSRLYLLVYKLCSLVLCQMLLAFERQVSLFVHIIYERVKTISVLVFLECYWTLSTRHPWISHQFGFPALEN